MATLYDDGWRQGTVLEAPLPCDCVRLVDAGPQPSTRDHSRWVIVTQDCDLAQTENTNPDALIELRPAFPTDHPIKIGIRSRFFAVSDEFKLDALSERTMITAVALTRLRDCRSVNVAGKRAKYLKKWLGYRYDRPAVPPEYVELAKRVGREVSRPRHRAIEPLLRDVLMAFEAPNRVRLYAVILDVANRGRVREWLGEIALAIPAEVGNVTELQAVTEGQVSITVLEDTYPADLSQLTVDREADD